MKTTNPTVAGDPLVFWQTAARALPAAPEATTSDDFATLRATWEGLQRQLSDITQEMAESESVVPALEGNADAEELAAIARMRDLGHRGELAFGLFTEYAARVAETHGITLDQLAGRQTRR